MNLEPLPSIILAHGGKLSLDLPQIYGLPDKQKLQPLGPIQAPSPSVIPDKEWRERERANILAALQQARFRVSGKGGAAELLGINPGTLTSRLKSLRIDKRDYRTKASF